MPFTNGVFTRLRNWVQDRANGLSMQPDLMDQDANDIAGALNNCLLRDGTGQPTANLPMAGKILTGLGQAANRQDGISLGQVQDMVTALSPSGTQIQGGYAATGAGANAAVAFASAFKNGVVSLVVTPISSDGSVIALEVYNVTAGGFAVNANRVNANGGGAVVPGINVGFYWLALGF